MKKISSALVAAAVLGFSIQANAAGYQLTEYSTTGLGRSFAGAGLVGDDYSAVAYNPAGMSYTTRSGVQLGLSSVGIRSTAKGYSTFGGEGKESPYIVRVLPHGFAQYRLNDRTVLGLGIYTPFGLATDYKNGWFGKTHAGRSEIQTVDVSPALSVNVTDSVALGASLNLQHSRAKLTSEVEGDVPQMGRQYLGGKAYLRGHDTSLGYTLGATWEPVKNKTRLGVSYRSKVVHDLRGKNTVSDTMVTLPGGIMMDTGKNSTINIKTKITTPETVTLSAWQRLTDKWSVSATARWTRWSQFKDLNIYDMTDNPVSMTNENWRNTWFYSLGADYQYCKNLIFRFGAAYDQSVVKGPEYRTARIPDGRRIWTSLGASYMKNNWQVDAGYAHLFVKDVKAEHGNAGASDYSAKYSSNANIFSLAVQYKF
ncbi:MAG: outer membrane protein transport protein [Alphaproteobacteria bacterium]|nr:outer membrane protein transport protein [Alphaproteobacteria bacterium]